MAAAPAWRCPTASPAAETATATARMAPTREGRLPFPGWASSPRILLPETAPQPRLGRRRPAAAAVAQKVRAPRGRGPRGTSPWPSPRFTASLPSTPPPSPRAWPLEAATPPPVPSWAAVMRTAARRNSSGRRRKPPTTPWRCGIPPRSSRFPWRSSSPRTADASLPGRTERGRRGTWCWIETGRRRGRCSWMRRGRCSRRWSGGGGAAVATTTTIRSTRNGPDRSNWDWETSSSTRSWCPRRPSTASPPSRRACW
mmetsp:Transcript_13040/g.38320  ORF Transcript_13040/g.38320 Transcript_13040/m.38320 type:complete len:256 (+) Transcript_13040:1040-1807(+)